MIFLPFLTILAGTHIAAAVMPTFRDETPPAPIPIQFEGPPPPAPYGYYDRPYDYEPMLPGWQYVPPPGRYPGGVMHPDDWGRIPEADFMMRRPPRSFPRFGGPGWEY